MHTSIGLAAHTRARALHTRRLRALAAGALLACTACGGRAVQSNDPGSRRDAGLGVAADSAGNAAPTADAKPPPPPPPLPPTPTPSPLWTCDPGSPRVCHLTGDDRGVPDGRPTWTCHEEIIDGRQYLTCASRDGSKVVTASGWSCRLVASLTWVCRRPKRANDEPPYPGYWACRASSLAGGRVCEQLAGPPQPAYPLNAPCKPGQRRWCDGLQYSGWGMATCTDGGVWPTRIVSGKQLLDCVESSEGRRPDTECACYHAYFNPSCCERPDCIVAANEPGRICQRSSGAVCDYCNPHTPECSVGLCVVANSMETFCTQPCAGDGSCPADSACREIKTNGTVSRQCVPLSFGCYGGL